MANKTLTLHLAKSDVVEFNQLLSEQALERVARNSTRIVEDASFGGGARLYVFVGDNTVPSWLRDIRSLFNVPAQFRTVRHVQCSPSEQPDAFLPPRLLMGGCFSKKITLREILNSGWL